MKKNNNTTNASSTFINEVRGRMTKFCKACNKNTGHIKTIYGNKNSKILDYKITCQNCLSVKVTNSN